MPVYPAANTKIQILIYFRALSFTAFCEILITLRLENSGWDFLRSIFDPGIFGGGGGTVRGLRLGIFWGFDFCHHLVIPVT